jgi:hypothetical protein
MLRVTFVFSFLLLTQSCNLDKSTQVNSDQIKFKTNDASELFFKNVRVLYYDLEENKDAKLNIYRKKDRERNDSIIHINLALTHNWQTDQAFLILEESSELNKIDKWTVTWKNSTGNSGSMIYNRGRIDEQTLFAVNLYNLLLDDYDIAINGKPILTSKEQREAFRITVFDFLRLTENL